MIDGQEMVKGRIILARYNLRDKNPLIYTGPTHRSSPVSAISTPHFEKDRSGLGRFREHRSQPALSSSERRKGLDGG